MWRYLIVFSTLEFTNKWHGKDLSHHDNAQDTVNTLDIDLS